MVGRTVLLLDTLWENKEVCICSELNAIMDTEQWHTVVQLDA